MMQLVGAICVVLLFTPFVVFVSLMAIRESHQVWSDYKKWRKTQ